MFCQYIYYSGPHVFRFLDTRGEEGAENITGAVRSLRDDDLEQVPPLKDKLIYLWTILMTAYVYQHKGGHIRA